MEALVVRQETGTVEYTQDHPEPTATVDEVRVRVRLAGICATDLEIVKGYMSFSGVPGHEFVGTVVEPGSSLDGRRITGEINCICGTCDMCRRGMSRHCRRRTVMGIQGRDGAFASLVSIPQRNCHVVPDEITDEQAVFVEPLAAAVEVIKLQPIDRFMEVAVIGAGRLGLLVAQVLKLQGCRLLVVGRNPQTLAFCERHGIQAIELADLTPKANHDVVVDCSGVPDGLELALRMVRPRGTVVLKSTYARPPKIDLAPVVINEIRVLGNRCGPFPEALELLREGRIEVDEMISRTYPLKRGGEALAAADRQQNLKVLLRPGMA